MTSVTVLTDMHGNRLRSGDQVRFHSSRGSVMKAEVGAGKLLGVMTEVVIGKDPFPTMVDHRQLEAVGANGRMTMPRSASASTAPSARELRRQAKNLRISGWEEMTREELADAIAEHGGADSNGEAAAPARARKATKRTAKRTSRRENSDGDDSDGDAPAKRTARKATKATKKRTAKKAPAAKKRTAAPRPPANVDTPNPYRPGTNLYYVTEALMRGGKRSALVRLLKPKLKFSPRVQSEADWDVDAEIDKRLKVIAYELANKHGFSRVQEGRGVDAFIKATPPE
jgi:hypothetical protein